jgi:hypothetical protein
VGRIWAALAAAAVVLWASAAQASETFALFVGIADYKHPSASLRPLQAPPNDVAAVRAALERRFGAYRHATVLLNGQATRAAILAALDANIRQAQPGDRLLFYYSGHGGQVFLQESADALADEADGQDETLIPYDARPPGSAELTDILDDELKQRIATANLKGVSVISILDSCNSGTATRGEAAPRGAIGVLRLAHGRRPPSVPADLTASNIALAAAQDRQQAWEDVVEGQPRGLFSYALERALATAPVDATWRDLIDATRLELEAVRLKLGYLPGEREQSPRAEGDLLMGLDSTRPSSRRVFEVSLEAQDGYQLHGGGIQGVAAGARFALYADSRQAAAGGAEPIATATATSVEAGRASLQVEGDWRPGATYARELTRSFPGGLLKLSLGGPQAEVLRPHLATLTFISLEGQADHRLVAADGMVGVMDHSGAEVARFAQADLVDALTRMAQVAQLLTANGNEPPNVELELMRVVGCQQAGCLKQALQPTRAAAPGVARFTPGELFATRISASGPPRYVYTLLVRPDFSIRLLYPPPGGPGAANRLENVREAPTVLRARRQAGDDRFVLIAADAPLDLAPLEQGAIAWRPGQSRGERGAAPRFPTVWSSTVHAARTE